MPFITYVPWLTLFRVLLRFSTDPFTHVFQDYFSYSEAILILHNDVIKWKHFPLYWPFVWGIHRSRWIPFTRASDTELWCFLWSAPEQKVEKAISTLMIWDAVALIMMIFQCQWSNPEECGLIAYCPACRTSLIATRFWVVMICPIIKCPTVLEFSFILFNLCLFITIFNFILNYVPIVTFWIFAYHKIWILLIIFCFISSYWIIYCYVICIVELLVSSVICRFSGLVLFTWVFFYFVCSS